MGRKELQKTVNQNGSKKYEGSTAFIHTSRARRPPAKNSCMSLCLSPSDILVIRSSIFNGSTNNPVSTLSAYFCVACVSI